MKDLIDFMSPTFYIRFSDNFLSVRHVEKRKTVEYPPDVLFDTEKGRVLAIGPDVERKRYSYRGTASVANGFKHPRTVFGDFDVASGTIKAYMKEARRGHVHIFKPVIIIHPLKDLEGGLTQIEIRACQDLAFVVGARKYYLWTGRELTGHEASSRQFPLSDGELIASRGSGKPLF